jgi:SAM-dependent methyltransferase
MAMPARDAAALRQAFWTDHRLGLNARRLEHLATLELDLAGRSVLEVGAGIGDLTMYFLDRRCRVLLTDARPLNVRCAAEDEQLRAQPRLRTQVLDLDRPSLPKGSSWDIAFCYGVLHLVTRPERALRWLAGACSGMLLLECEVAPGGGAVLLPAARPQEGPTGPVGAGCATPTPGWLIEQLRQHFRFVSAPCEPPPHPDFAGEHPGRAVFVAAHHRLDSPRLRPLTP